MAVSVTQPPNDLVDLLSARGLHEGERVAYTFLEDGQTETGSLTYGELDRAARGVAAWLLDHADRGDRALLIYPSGLEFLKAFFGCLYAGVIAVPLYPPRRNRIDQRIESVGADAQATVALTTTQILTDMQRRVENARALERIPWQATDGDDLAERGAEFQPAAGTIAFLQYTSGSTAAPKGVMVSHANLIDNLAAMDQCWRHTPSSVMVSWLPVFHDMGLVYGILQPLFNGLRCYFMPSAVFFQQPMRWLEAVSRYRGTHSAAPNFAYDLCAQNVKPEQLALLDLSSLRMSLNGAEPLRAVTLKRFDESFSRCGLRPHTVCTGYGLAEATLAVSTVHYSTPVATYTLSARSLADDRVEEVSGEGAEAQTLVSSGPPAPGTRIEIVDPQSLKRCPPNRVGEIWVSGPGIASGYWGRAEATQETFRAELADTGEGPFLRTGDLGFLNKGHLFVTGRLKDMIIVRGQNIYPQDIELTIEQCHSALRPNCGAAFGVDVNGEERLVVVHEVNRTYVRNLDTGEVVSAIQQAILDQHGLDVHAVVLLRTTSLPKTSSGKVQRHACKKGYLDNSLKVVGQWNDAPDVVDALSPMDHVDTAFYGVDSEATPQVIAAVCILDRPPDMGLIESRLAQAVDMFPRLRQAIVRTPSLTWKTDPAFALGNHIESIQKPAIQGRSEVLAEAGTLIRSVPRLDRPPWQVVVITNGQDQSCLVLRAHHAFVDGVRLLRLLEVLGSPSRDSHGSRPVEQDTLQPPALESALERMRYAGRCSRKLLTERLIPCGTSALNGTTSGERSVTTADVPRADLVRSMRHYKGSLHDVIFTILAGAIRRYQDRQGLQNKDMRLIVPTSVPPRRDKGGLGNHLVISALTLPVSEPDAMRRLRRTQELFGRMKSHGTIGAYEFMAKVVHRLVPRRLHRMVWESVLSRTNAVCTVLLGPEDERYLGGARVESIYGVTAPVIGHGAGFAFVNYAGRVCVSVTTDSGVITHPQQLMDDFQAELRDFLTEANADAESGEWPARAAAGEHTARSKEDFRQQWEAIPVSDRPDILRDHVRGQVARVLGHSDNEALPPGHKLTDLGIDSLLAVELRTRLHTSLGGPLPETLLLDHPTIESLAAFLSQHLAAGAAVARS